MPCTIQLYRANFAIAPPDCGWEAVTMAEVIKFYVPGKFRQRVKWVPRNRRGKVIQFPARQRKSA